MKSVEFGFASTGEETTGQDSNTSSSATPDLISGSVVSKQSLELLLLEKNKKLQNEATNLRNSNASLQGVYVMVLYKLLYEVQVVYKPTEIQTSYHKNKPKARICYTIVIKQLCLHNYERRMRTDVTFGWFIYSQIFSAGLYFGWFIHSRTTHNI